MSERTPKPMPVLLTDEDAERFIEAARLSEHDLSGFEPMRFELAPKDERVDMRLSGELLAEVGRRRRGAVCRTSATSARRSSGPCRLIMFGIGRLPLEGRSDHIVACGDQR